MDPEDKRLLEASASGQTDGVLQLLEEPNGHQLHKFKGQKISKGNSGVFNSSKNQLKKSIIACKDPVF